MKIKKTGSFWQVTPAAGKYLTDGAIVTAEAACPTEAAAARWREVTAAEAEAIMAAQQEEDEPGG